MPNGKGKVLTKCPICGFEELYDLISLSNKGYKCKICNSIWSIPNKFIRCIIFLKKDILDNFKFEYYSKWEDTAYRYDAYFVFQGKEYIVEMQGIQHYTEIFNNKFTNQKEIDKNKKELALRNGIDFYIEIDVKRSEPDYLKNSFIESGLNDIFNLSESDFKNIYNKMNEPLLKEILELYNKGKEVKEIALILSVSNSTINRKLNKAQKMGLIKLRRPNYGNIKTKVINVLTGEEYVFETINESWLFIMSEGIKVGKNKFTRYIKKI